MTSDRSVRHPTDTVSGMMVKIGKRLAGTFLAAAIPNALVGSALDVDLWRSAVMSGAIAVLGVVQLLAAGLADDGELSDEEVDAAFRK